MENEPSERAAEVIDRWIGSQAKLKYLPGFTDPVQKEFVLPFPPEAAMQGGHNKTGLFSKGLSGEQPVPLGRGTFQLLAVAWTVLEAEVIGQTQLGRQGLPGGQWLKVSQPCALVAKQTSCTLSCLSKSVASTPRAVSLLLYLALVRPCLGSCVQFGAPWCVGKVWTCGSESSGSPQGTQGA